MKLGRLCTLLLAVILAFGGQIAVGPAESALAATRVIDGKSITEGPNRFASVSKPAISGTKAVGKTLTAKPGAARPAAEAWTYQWYRSGKAISGATARTYKLVGADKGKRITVRATAWRNDYAKKASAASSKTSAIKAGSLSTSKPVIAGTKNVGQTLRAQAGSWTKGTRFSFQWLRNGKKISKATKSTYKLAASDRGKQISVKVTGKLSGYTTKSVTSSKTSKIGAALKTLASSTPTITGTVQVGQTLTAKPGSWTAGAKLTYQWLRNGATVSGATSTTYKLVASDLGTRISVRVTGTEPGYLDKTVTSAATAAVTAAPPLTLTSAAPTIAGDAQVGSTLTAAPGAWTSGVTFTYQWLRNGAAIQAATASSYLLTAADSGRQIAVRVTGARSGYETQSRDSSYVLVADAILTASTPTISGSMCVGHELSVAAGAWTPGTQFVFVWLSDGKPIAGANSATFTPTTAELSHWISVRVMGSRPGYTARTLTSSETYLDVCAIDPAPTPTITGDPYVGSTLTATTDVWESGTSVAWQWLRNNVEIASASGATYTATLSDVGETISVRATGTLAGHATLSTHSAGVTIANAPLQAADVTITGTVKVGLQVAVDTAGWTPGTSFSYKWTVNGTTAGTASSLVLKPEHVGRTLAVQVTGTASGYTTVTRTATAAAQVAPGDFEAQLTLPAATPRVAQALTISPAMAPAGASIKGASWYVSPVSGDLTNLTTRQNGSSFTPAATDLDQYIYIAATIAAPGYNDAKVTAWLGQVELGQWTRQRSLRLTTSVPRVGQSVGYSESGTLSPTADAASLQWVLAGGEGEHSEIPGATGPTYEPVPDDIGHTLILVKTYTKAGYEPLRVEGQLGPDNSASPIAAGVLNPTPKPTITGVGQVGETLTANAGTWAEGVAFGYQWTRNGEAILGATGPTYTLVKADREAGIRVRVTGTRTGYNSASVTSDPVGPITVFTYHWDLRLGITRDGQPVTGNDPLNVSPLVRFTVVGSTGDGGGDPSPTVSNGERIWGAEYEPGADRSDYRMVVCVFGPAAVDEGSWSAPVITDQNGDAWTSDSIPSGWGNGELAACTGSLMVFEPRTLTTDQTLTVTWNLMPPVPAGSVAITGVPQVHQTVAAELDGWPEGTEFSYQWIRPDDPNDPIRGATAPTYPLTYDDSGLELAVRVTATLDGHTPITVTSDPVGPITTLTHDMDLELQITQDGVPVSGDDTLNTTALLGVGIVARNGDGGGDFALTRRNGDTIWTSTYEPGYEKGPDRVLVCVAGPNPVSGGTWSGPVLTDQNGAIYTPDPVPADWGSGGLGLGFCAGKTQILLPETIDAETVLTATWDLVSLPLVPAGTVSIDGTPKVYESLTAVVDGWPAGTVFTYEWLIYPADPDDESYSATGPTLELAKDAEGAQVAVRVTASLDGYRPATVTSERIGPVDRITKSLDLKFHATKDGDTYTSTARLVSRWVVFKDGRHGGDTGADTLRNGDTLWTDRYDVDRSKGDDRAVVCVFGPRVVGSPGTWHGPVITDQSGAIYTPDPIPPDWGAPGLLEELCGGATPIMLPDTLDANTVLTATWDFDTHLPGAVFVSGAPQVGQTLTAIRSGWPSGTEFTYRWLRNGQSIGGATNVTYTLTDQDEGAGVSVRVTGYRDGNLATTVTSAAVGPVTILRYSWEVRLGIARLGTPVTGDDPLNTSALVRTGLVAADGSGAVDAEPTKRNGDLVFSRIYRAGVTNTDRKVVCVFPPDAVEDGSWDSSPILTDANGALVGAEEVPSSGGASGEIGLEDCAGAHLLIEPASLDADTVLNVVWNLAPYSEMQRGGFGFATSPEVGDTLEFSVSSDVREDGWPEGTTFTYQWLRDGGEIPGETTAEYLVTGADVGTVLSVRVTARAAGYLPTTFTATTDEPVAMAYLWRLKLGITRDGVPVTGDDPLVTAKLVAMIGVANNGDGGGDDTPRYQNGQTIHSSTYYPGKSNSYRMVLCLFGPDGREDGVWDTPVITDQTGAVWASETIPTNWGNGQLSRCDGADLLLLPPKTLAADKTLTVTWDLRSPQAG